MSTLLNYQTFSPKPTSFVPVLVTSNDMKTKRKSNRPNDLNCNLKNCYLCNHGLNEYLQGEFSLKGWHKRIIPTIIFLEETNGKEWQHLTFDVFPYIAMHWQYYWPQGSNEDPNERSWKESVKALVSRKKHTFISGKEVFSSRGYWKLKDCIDKSLFKRISQSTSYSSNSHKKG